jgi:hypothetical protein
MTTQLQAQTRRSYNAKTYLWLDLKEEEKLKP